MSYVRPNTGNSMHDYFKTLNDFYILAPNLLRASSARSFELWTEKLDLIDRRSLFIYLKFHKHEIPEEYLKIAQRKYLEKI